MLVYFLSITGFVLAGEKTIFDAIFNGYDKRFRPYSSNKTEITKVTVTPSTFRLLNVDGLEQSIRFFIDFSQSWKDTNLVWSTSTSADFNYSKIKVPESVVWMPDISVFSSVSQDAIIPSSKRVVEIKNNGKVTKTVPMLVTNPCQLQVADFPFDEQECVFKVGPWVYSKLEILLVVDLNTYTNHTDQFMVFNLISAVLQGSNEWELKSFSAEVSSSTDVGNSTSLTDSIKLKVRIRRISTHYIYAVIIPTFINCCLCMFGLFMPTDTSGVRIEKVTLGVTCLLGMAMTMGSTLENMPKASRIPALGIFILAECLLCFFATATTSVLSFAHERVTTRMKLPPMWLARFLLCKRYDYELRKRTMSVQTGFAPSSTIGRYLRAFARKIEEVLSKVAAEGQWTRIFDRLDIFFMIIYQTANIIILIVVLAQN